MLVVLAIGVALATSAAVLAIGSTDTRDNPSGGPPGSGIDPEKGSCPRHPQFLPRDAIAGATEDALREAPSLYGDAKNLEGMRALVAVVATAHQRGGEVRGEFGCNARDEKRTVVVVLYFPAEPGTSLSQGTVFVVRTAGRYRVWAVVH